MDTRVRDKIMALTESGVRNISEMQRRIRDFVDVELFNGQSVPTAVDTRFRPLSSTILNTMYRTTSRMR